MTALAASARAACASRLSFIEESPSYRGSMENFYRLN
jgi:hypothetical protein